MELKQTVIIPKDTNTVDEQIIKEIKEKKDTLMLIILGDDKDVIAQKAVECADYRATFEIAGFQRLPVWIQNREFFRGSLYQYLEITPGNSGFSIDHIDTVVALSISPEREIRQILINTDKINYTTIEQAFLKAGE